MLHKTAIYSGLSLAICGASSLGTPALAQTGQLEEVIVTATKRAESLQDIPVTVNALTESTIQEAGVTDIGDVAALVPSLTVSQNINPFSAAIRIRGFGTSQNDPSLEASVAFILDGVYMGSSGLGMSDLTDIERIENQAKNRLLALKHQDKFIWWMDNQDPEKQLSDIQVRLAILSGMDKQIDVDVIYTPQLIKQVSETGSDILVRIVNSKNDLKSSDFLASKLAKHGVMTTKKRSKKVTHALTLTSEYRQDKIGVAFISTKLTQLKLINSQGKLIANNELISTANSLTSYKLSKEGAERHFSAQIDELGLWQAMGF